MADFRVVIAAEIVAELVTGWGPNDAELAGQEAVERARLALVSRGLSLREPLVREIARVDREGEAK